MTLWLDHFRGTLNSAIPTLELVQFLEAFHQRKETNNYIILFLEIEKLPNDSFDAFESVIR
jgi:hypothetical protein